MINQCHQPNCIFDSLKATLIFIVAFFSLSVSAQAGAKNHARNTEYWRISGLNRLRAAALQHKISKIEVYYLPYTIETFFRSTPESLKEGYTYHLTEKDMMDSPREKSLARAIGLTQVLKSNINPQEIRIGIIFFDSADHHISSIYFNPISNGVCIDGTYYELGHKTLFNWVKTTYIRNIDAM